MEAAPTFNRRGLLALAAAAIAAPAWAQETKACAVVLLHAEGSAPASLAPLAKKLQAVCATRVPEMPWSARRASVDAVAALQDVGRVVKELRQQGHRRIVVAGHGLGANAALAYAGRAGDVEGVIALGGEAGGGFGELPALAPAVRQHIALLWVVGTGDPLAKRGEDYAFAKAPPHPGSRYVQVKADAAGTAEAAAKAMLEWLKQD